VAPETAAAGLEPVAGEATPVPPRFAFGGSDVVLRARGLSLGGAGFTTTGRGRVRGGSIVTGGRFCCAAPGGPLGVAAGAELPGPASGAAAVAGAWELGATCASPDPKVENKQVATIVELSHRDFHAPSGEGPAAKLDAAMNFERCELRLAVAEDMETPRVARPVARHRE
jgi:hypothetical protein